MGDGPRQNVETLFHVAMAGQARSLVPGDYLGHYRIVRRLGEGGMGVVFEAHDERLDRRVAVKLLRRDAADPHARERLVREARIAARATHPQVCQVYELGEAPDGPFIVMELVDGESLADRLARERLPLVEAIRVALSLLDALTVLHNLGIVHRDLKPSNVFLSPSGIKLLDFGLARPLLAPTTATADAVTAPGMFVGTPQYASPEQLMAGDIDARSDVFSAGVIAYELLAGHPPFTGSTLPALVHAITYDTPAVLTGSAAIAAADRVLHRAMAKAPDDRYASAQAFASDLRPVLALAEGSNTVVAARPMLRLAVVPFRQLRPDAATDYLGPSLADALAGSLAGLESLVVRSTLKSARYGQPTLDLERIAGELSVDVVLTGSLLASRGRMRVTAELVSAPGGDVWWSRAIDTTPDAVLELHDELAQQVLAALPLSARDKQRAPLAKAHNDKAFDLYLHGMQLRAEPGAWRQAHAFFVRSVDADPAFAAAWAERGRMERVLGKFEDPAMLGAAEASFERALDIDDDNGAAQYYYAQLDVDLGRVEAALHRLLARAWLHRAEPHVYAALVHTCRYGGLLDASVAAHRAAAHLDPTVATSVLHTYYMQGDFARALTEAHRSSDPFEARLLGAMGRREEARHAARTEEARFAAVPLLRAFSTGMRTALDGDQADTLTALAPFDAAGFTDGEGLFYVAEIYAAAGLYDRAQAMLERAVDGGFLCVPAFERDVYLAPLRDGSGWTTLLTRLRTAQTAVARAFERGRGRSLLGT